MADEWFKLWHELRRDEKLEEIAAVMGVPLATVIGYWVSLLCLAHELDEDWHLRLTDGRAMRVERIAAGIHADVDTAKRFLAECHEMHMVVTVNGSPMIANGGLRNRYPSQSKSALAERQRKSRAAKKQALEGVSRGQNRDVSRVREEEKRDKTIVSQHPVDNPTESPLRHIGDIIADVIPRTAS